MFKHFSVLLLIVLTFVLMSCADVASSSDLGTSDTIAPQFSTNGVITLSAASDSIYVSWNAAVDDTTAQSDLEYCVYYTTDNSALFNTVAHLEANGTAFGDFHANMTSVTIIGLASSTWYNVNVVVKDEAGNKTSYASKQITTL